MSDIVVRPVNDPINVTQSAFVDEYLPRYKHTLYMWLKTWCSLFTVLGKILVHTLADFETRISYITSNIHLFLPNVSSKHQKWNRIVKSCGMSFYIIDWHKLTEGHLLQAYIYTSNNSQSVGAGLHNI